MQEGQKTTEITQDSQQQQEQTKTQTQTHSESIESYNKIQTLEGEIQARDHEITELKQKLTNYDLDQKKLLSEKNKLTDEINNVKQSIQDIHTKTAMNQIKTELLRRGFDQEEQSVILKFMDLNHKQFNMNESGNYYLNINEQMTDLSTYVDMTMTELKPIVRYKKQPSTTTDAGMEYWKAEQEKKLQAATNGVNPKTAGSAVAYIEQILNNYDKNNI